MLGYLLHNYQDLGLFVLLEFIKVCMRKQRIKWHNDSEQSFRCSWYKVCYLTEQRRNIKIWISVIQNLKVHIRIVTDSSDQTSVSAEVARDTHVRTYFIYMYIYQVITPTSSKFSNNRVWVWNLCDERKRSKGSESEGRWIQNKVIRNSWSSTHVQRWIQVYNLHTFYVLWLFQSVVRERKLFLMGWRENSWKSCFDSWLFSSMLLCGCVVSQDKCSTMQMFLWKSPNVNHSLKISIWEF